MKFETVKRLYVLCDRNGGKIVNIRPVKSEINFNVVNCHFSKMSFTPLFSAPNNYFAGERGLRFVRSYLEGISSESQPV